MICSLPIFSQEDLSEDQTTLALAILRKLSGRMSDRDPRVNRLSQDQFRTSGTHKDIGSDEESSSSYSTAEEDHFYDEKSGPAQEEQHQTDLMEIQFQQPPSPALRQAKSLNISLERSTGSRRSSLKALPDPGKVGLRLQELVGSGAALTVVQLQTLFDCFKVNELGDYECEALLDLLLGFQAREDFQWALHQLGGFNAILFLYGRVLEMCSKDSIQAKGLSLVLIQLRTHAKITDSPPAAKYHLIRFLLGSSRAVLGFRTFVLLLNSCLNPKGNRLEDYDLLNICLLSSWRKLIRTRVSEADAPTGNKTLLEAFLCILLDLTEEKNPHRDYNVALFRAHKFAETLLAISVSTLGEAGWAELGIVDALKMGAHVKSLLAELMAPPDPGVALSLIQFGLLPLLPKDLPPLPRKEDAFFVYQKAGDLNLGLEEDNGSEEDNTRAEAGLGRRVEGEATPLTPPEEGYVEAFSTAVLEAVMSILLSSLSLLPDEGFRTVLGPHISPHLFLAFASHPNPTLKGLALKLLSAYLSRVKSPVLTEFVKSRGFCLASLYTQASPELAGLVLGICTGYGPVSYALLTGLIYSNTVVNNLIQWIQHDESGVASALLSMGLLPSVLNFYRSSQQLPRPLITLLSLVTKYSVLNPKDEPWKVLFCAGIESAPSSSFLSARLLQDATEMLRKYNGKELRKSDASARLLWLLERGTGLRAAGHQFDKWLLRTFTAGIFELEESAESETWRTFVKKSRRRLQFLFGLLLCRLFAPNKGDLDFKQYTLRLLVLSCPNLAAWLPKVLRSDEQIERSFTAFTRVFLSEAETRGNGRYEPSFQSLVSSGGNLILTLQTAAAVGLPDLSSGPNDLDLHLSERAVRSKFELLLVEAGILSPSNNFGGGGRVLADSDFKTFQIRLDATPISGVSYHELRQCLASVEKIRAGLGPRTGSLKPTIKVSNGPNSLGLLQVSNCAGHFEAVFEVVSRTAVEVLDVVTRLRTRSEIDLARRISVRVHDIEAKEVWWGLREGLVHPKAAWHFPAAWPAFWALDQTEGPGRVRTRLHKEPLKVHPRFVREGRREADLAPGPLDYLFASDLTETLNYPVIQTEIQFIRFCVRIIPGEELPGELILSATSLHFFCEACHSAPDHCSNSKVNLDRRAVVQVLRRRYTLEDRAAEIFVDSQSYLLVFRTLRDREEFIGALAGKGGAYSGCPTKNSILMNSSLTTMTSQWVKGTLSNFDYLMYLNTAAGRTYSDLMQYPVFPFVLAKYEAPTLDLHAPQSYRDLKKPMAIQDPAKEEHFVSTYNYLKRECDSTPFHYGSHYSNSGIVLHFLVRLPPYTQHFLKYQDGSFDIPDRSFHSVETTWRLASKESNTDFKEAIPEFYYLPEFLQNLQNFDLGVRQNGTRVEDVRLPPWAKGNPRLFTLINRQALESQQARKYLGDWIDLVFGYKQTGKPAIQAINVFHPSTYEGFDVEGAGTDDLIRRARKAMVSTYGQSPKRLFAFPHPRPQLEPNETCEQEAVDTVWGIRWGRFLGSPASPDLDVINTREYREPVALFETNSRIVFWPKNTLILGDVVVGSWDTSGVRIKSNLVYLCIGDEITACAGIDTTLWVGHQSGRISVLKLSAAFDKFTEKIELVGHYSPVKHIDLNHEFSVAISCSGEDYALVWDMNLLAFTNIIEHDEGIDFVYSSKSTGDVLLLNRESNSVTLVTINGFRIGRVTPEEQIESACLSGLDPGRNVNVLAVGCDYGIIKFYSTWDLRCVNQIKVLPLSTLAIKSIRYSRDGRRVYCMSQTDQTYVTVALQLSSDPTRRNSFS